MPFNLAEDIERWPDRPVLVKSGDGSARVQANSGTACLFESELFTGRLLIFIAGLPTTPPGFFEGQKRRTHLIIQVWPQSFLASRASLLTYERATVLYSPGLHLSIHDINH